jgi:hypothetical protein
VGQTFYTNLTDPSHAYFVNGSDVAKRFSIAFNVASYGLVNSSAKTVTEELNVIEVPIVSDVPEPGTYAMFLLGGAALAAALRRPNIQAPATSLNL